MAVARHPRPPELVGVPIEDIMNQLRRPIQRPQAGLGGVRGRQDRRLQARAHRFIGAGGSGKHGDTTVIPAAQFTLSIMFVEPGQGNAAHTHEVEECFFVLQGFLMSSSRTRRTSG